MTSFAVSGAARNDLKAIAVYTQNKWGPVQRRTYLKGLDLAFHYLADNPHAGTPCDFIVIGLRKHTFQSHMIFYTNQPNGVFIVRVLHKSMDVVSRLTPP